MSKHNNDSGPLLVVSFGGERFIGHAVLTLSGEPIRLDEAMRVHLVPTQTGVAEIVIALGPDNYRPQVAGVPSCWYRAPEILREQYENAGGMVQPAKPRLIVPR